MATINAINSNQLLSTTNSVTFAALTLTSALTVPNGGTGAATFTANSLLLGNGAGALTALGPATDGQLVIGSTGVAPVLATLTAGTNISIVNAAGSITINSTAGSGFTWNVITANTASMVANNGYFCDISNMTFAPLQLTLPASAAVGDTFRVYAMNTGGFTVKQNAGQSIQIGSSVTTVGTGGSLTSTSIGDSILIVCNVANTGFTAISEIGNITVV